MQFFKRKLMYPTRYTEETSKETSRLFKEYTAHLNRIQNSLPAGARELAGISFHDGTIKQVKHISKKEIEIVVEGGPHSILTPETWDYGEYTLSFLGAKKVWVPYTIVGDTWLYEEMSLSDIAAFDYQVLLHKDEIRIQADDVRISRPNAR